jgi:predicted thioesterase
MPTRRFEHTVTPDDTAATLGSGDLDILATPRLVAWCEAAALEVCRSAVPDGHTTVGTLVRIEHVAGSPVGSTVSIRCCEPINDGRRLVCLVKVRDCDGAEVAHGEIHRAVVDPERFMSRCRSAAA